MSDVRLKWDPVALSGDFVIVNEDLAVDDGLQTACLLSLFCNAPARSGDVLPDGTIAKGGEGGWWADGVPVVPGDRFGSRLWLLDRSKNTPDILPRAELYAREGLQWFIDDGVASQVDVVSSLLLDFSGRVNGRAELVTIHRPGLDPARFRFGRLWTAEENAS